MLTLFSKNKKKRKVQTFTYYIPAPPARKSGYREKEFDRLCFTLTQLDFEIKNIHTQSHHNDEASGMWVILTLYVPKKYENTFDDNLESILKNAKDNDQASQAKKNQSQVDGIYYEEEFELYDKTE